MEILILSLISIYIVSIFLLAVYYEEHNITPNIWSITSIFIPIINTSLICYFLFKNKRKEVNEFFSIKKFFNDLKDN